MATVTTEQREIDVIAPANRYLEVYEFIMKDRNPMPLPTPKQLDELNKIVKQIKSGMHEH